MKIVKNLKRFHQELAPQFKVLLLAATALLALGGVTRDEQGGNPLLEPLASWPGYGRGPAMEVAVQGRHAYVAAGAGGLVVVDVDDPATPTRVGGYWAPGTTRRVKADGTRLYIARTVSGGGGCLANSRGRLDVLDVSDPVRPKLLGAYATAQEIKDFQIVDQRAHLLMKGEGLEMVDLRDPSRPASLGARAFADPTTLFICG